jgi:hypothetical protein
MLVYQRVDDRKRIELDEFPILFRIVIPGFFIVILIGNIQWDNVGNPSCDKPRLGVVGIPAIKMVMTWGWFMKLGFTNPGTLMSSYLVVKNHESKTILIVLGMVYSHYIFQLASQNPVSLMSIRYTKIVGIAGCLFPQYGNVR